MMVVLHVDAMWFFAAPCYVTWGGGTASAELPSHSQLQQQRPVRHPVPGLRFDLLFTGVALLRCVSCKDERCLREQYKAWAFCSTQLLGGSSRECALAKHDLANMIDQLRQQHLSGGVAGTSVDVALYPLDTIKTRLQSSQAHVILRKLTVADANADAKRFLKAGGFNGVYRGLSAAAVGSAPGAAVFFSSYETLKCEALHAGMRHVLLDGSPCATTAGMFTMATQLQKCAVLLHDS
eukprot:2458-Heterococcus_DN1.PRE.3